MEIYNEEINDLLAPEAQKLQIHESAEVHRMPIADFSISRMHSQWFLQQFQSNYIDWRTVDEDMYLFHYV
jgi:hypothetical protein